MGVVILVAATACYTALGQTIADVSMYNWYDSPIFFKSGNPYVGQFGNPAARCADASNKTIPCIKLNVLSALWLSVDSPGPPMVAYPFYFAMTRMIQRINLAQKLLPGYEITIRHVDTKFNYYYMEREVFAKELIAKKGTYVGVLGTATSTEVPGAAWMLRSMRLPLFTGTLTSDHFDDDKVPVMVSANVPDSKVVLPFSGLTRRCGWKNIGIVYEPVQFGPEAVFFKNYLEDKANGYNLLFYESMANVMLVDQTFDAIRRTRARVIFVWSEAEVMMRLTCEMYHRKMDKIIFLHFVSTPWFQGLQAYLDVGDPWFLARNCTDQSILMDKAKYYVGFAPIGSAPFHANASKPLTCLPDMSLKQLWDELFQNQAASLAKEGFPFGVVPEYGPCGDSACLFALYLRHMLIEKGYTPDEIAAGRADVYQDYLDWAWPSIFGISGPVVYQKYLGPNGTRRPGARKAIMQTYRMMGSNPNNVFTSGGPPPWDFGPMLPYFEELEGGKLIDDAIDNIQFEEGLAKDGKCPPDLFAPCGVGEELIQGECTPCAEGRFLASDVTCQPCMPGTYMDHTGATECTSCPSGTHMDVSGSAACKLCPLGHSTGGKERKLQCDSCLPGQQAAKAGEAVCTSCPHGTYATTEASSSCTMCPPGLTTFDIASESINVCLCPEGQYLQDLVGGVHNRGLGACSGCPKGLTCAFGTMEDDFWNATSTSPNVNEGCYTFPDDPFSVYECRPLGLCNGGPPASANQLCNGLRQGALCTLCPMGYVEDGNTCAICRAHDYVVFIIAAICIGIALPALILKAATLDPIRQHPHALQCGLLAGQVVTFLQVVAALANTPLKWGNPFHYILQGMKFLSFDLNIIRVKCVGITQRDLVGDALLQYILKMIMPTGGVIILAFGAIMARQAMRRPVVTINDFINSVGQIMMVVVTSLALAILTPFQCYTHPNGKESVNSAPTILCNGTGKHAAMLTIAFLSIPIYLIGFSAFVLWAVVRYPKEIVKDNIAFVRRFRFLFVRWRPECYWFCLILMIRNLAVAIFPMVIPPEYVSVTLGLLHVFLLAHLVLLCWTEPWRSGNLNHMDMFMGFLLVLIVNIGTSGGRDQEIAVGPSALLTVLMFVAIGAAALVALERLIVFLRGRPKFVIFISHHKGGGACAARFLKMYFANLTKGPMFYDCDDLKSLGDLFDAVRDSRHLLVLMSGETLCRPWCMGEVVTAYRNKVPMWSVTISAEDRPAESMDQFTNLPKDEMTALLGNFEVLRPYGVDLDDVMPAVRELLDRPTRHLNFADTDQMNGVLDSLAGVLLGRSLLKGTALPGVSIGSAGSNAEASHAPSSPSKNGGSNGEAKADLLFLVDYTDAEAMAASRVLKMYVQKNTHKLAVMDNSYSTADIISLFQREKNCLVYCLLTKMPPTLTQVCRIHLFQTMHPTESLFLILIGSSFVFPDKNFYQSLANTGGPYGQDVDFRVSRTLGLQVTKTDLEKSISRLFSNIAYFVNVPHAAEAVLYASMDTLINKTNVRSAAQKNWKPSVLPDSNPKLKPGVDEVLGVKERVEFV